MYIIAGLGNPTRDYKGTRHNVGFDAIDAIAEKYKIGVDSKKHKGIFGTGYIEGYKVVLVKPQTYMNLSGESIREFMDYYKINPEDELIVLFDDIDLDVGQLRIRKKGSAGGHNGIKSIISHVGTQNFMRIKIGVGEKPKHMDLADYVLGHFSKEERPVVDEAIDNAVKAVELMITQDVDAAMNLYNQKVR
ncbi:aminoacyl-tRNA hydrolase [Konateibacter massiliensis]|uniref:aminoacyl-tRNA hydrolase n=1 Tax=Konateibacter massiliensis TaxID=2002841 RepID=UPI0015D47FF3|nr:aminoacyl-tRNA hydrolase [Konateibacter massiliensis]